MTPPLSLPHDYLCDCQRCKAIIAAIVAQWPDGSYVFTEDELLKLATQEGR